MAMSLFFWMNESYKKKLQTMYVFGMIVLLLLASLGLAYFLLGYSEPDQPEVLANVGAHLIYLSQLLAWIGLLFIPKSKRIWVLSLVPLALYLPLFITTLGVFRWDFLFVSQTYWELVLLSPAELIAFLLDPI